MLINVVQIFVVVLSKISSYIKFCQPWYMDSGVIVQVIGFREKVKLVKVVIKKTSKLTEEKIIAFKMLVPEP